MYNSKIIGLGKYLPETVVTNDDLSKLMDTNDAWIRERTGIEERRWIDPKTEDNTSVMGAKAAKQAIERAGLTKDDIDFIIFATLSPDMYFPGGGVEVQAILDMPTIGALDIRNQCSGFLYALSVADNFIKTGMYKNVLVIGSEYHSGGLDRSDRGRGVTVIFGDGAGAAVLTRTENNEEGILSTHLHAEGKHARELTIEGPGMEKWVDKYVAEGEQENPKYYPHMNGPFVFKNAVVRFSEVINEALHANKMTKEDIDLLVPHQANLRISQFVQKQFQLPDDKVYNNIMRYGNTTAASVIIALTEAWEEGKVKKGDNVVLAAFGSGFTWASALIKWA